MEKDEQDLYTLAQALCDELGIEDDDKPTLHVIVTAFRKAQQQVTGVFVPPTPIVV